MPAVIDIIGEDEVVSESSVQKIKSAGANTTPKKEIQVDDDCFVIHSRESLAEYISTDKIPMDKKGVLFVEALERLAKTDFKVNQKSE